jgi:hypothetical protein
MSPYTDPLLDVRLLLTELDTHLERMADEIAALKADNARLARDLVAAQAQRDTAAAAASAYGLRGR